MSDAATGDGAKVTVACLELAPEVGELARNARDGLGGDRAAARSGADVIVLPELVTSGYCFASTDEARSVSIRRDDPIFRRWATEAAGAVVVAGFAELGDDDRLYNSAVLLDAPACGRYIARPTCGTPSSCSSPQVPLPHRWWTPPSAASAC